VREYLPDRGRLPVGELTDQGDVDLCTVVAAVRHVQARSGVFDDPGDQVP
jgi:hypothetical protein